MKNVTTAFRDALKGRHQYVLLCDIEIGSTTYYVTDSDKVISYGGADYQPHYLVGGIDVEVTSRPRINEISVLLDAADQTFSTLVLSQAWMNKPVLIRRMLLDESGTQLGVTTIFKGLIASYSLSETPRQVELSVASIWADFEKKSGTRTNLKSQQRVDSTDTAPRHSARAMLNRPWGKEGPRNSGTTGSGGGSTSKFNEPSVEP